jgi:hypothetical protein
MTFSQGLVRHHGVARFGDRIHSRRAVNDSLCQGAGKAPFRFTQLPGTLDQ